MNPVFYVFNNYLFDLIYTYYMPSAIGVNIVDSI